MITVEAPRRTRDTKSASTPGTPQTGQAMQQALQDEACCAPCPESPLSAGEAAGHARVLKALADPQRLRMLALIAAQPVEQPLCVCEIEEGFDLTQGTVSHHLRVLREAGLVTVSKQGLWHYYAPAPGGLTPVKTLLAGLSTRSA